MAKEHIFVTIKLADTFIKGPPYVSKCLSYLETEQKIHLTIGENHY